MKTILLFIISILLVTQKVSSQTIFAPQNSVWNYYREGEPPNYNVKYQTEKDTIFRGHLCSKVIGEKSWLSGTKDILAPNFFYTSEDTVFYYHDSLKDFTPLYIFNVKVGDTLTYVAPPAWYKSIKVFTFLVTKIDTSIIDGISLRSVFTTAIYPYGTWHDKYTERIGGYRIGSIVSYSGPTTADHSIGIRCYHDNEIDEKFVSDKWDCDYVPTSIDEAVITYDIRIYPNPANRVINIDLNTSKINGAVFIFSIEGKLLVQKELTESKTQIDISHLASGTYVLQLKSKNEVYTQKLQIIR